MMLMSLHHQQQPEYLPEGHLPCDQVRKDGVVVHSLTAHAIQALERHKWIESQKFGYDIGFRAYEEWLQHCWGGWIRSKLLEHLYGWRYWGAFSKADYGFFSKSSVEHHVSQEVLQKVADLLAAGGENLDVLNWALSADHDVEAIMWLLDRIDINAKRQRLLTKHIRLFLHEECSP